MGFVILPFRQALGKQKRALGYRFIKTHTYLIIKKGKMSKSKVQIKSKLSNIKNTDRCKAF